MIDGPGSMGWSGTGVRAARRRAAAVRIGSAVGSAGAVPAAVEPGPGTDATGLAPWSGRGSATGPSRQGRRQREFREHDDREEGRCHARQAGLAPIGTAEGEGASGQPGTIVGHEVLAACRSGEDRTCAGPVRTIARRSRSGWVRRRQVGSCAVRRRGPIGPAPTRGQRRASVLEDRSVPVDAGTPNGPPRMSSVVVSSQPVTARQ